MSKTAKLFILGCVRLAGVGLVVAAVLGAVFAWNQNWIFPGKVFVTVLCVGFVMLGVILLLRPRALKPIGMALVHLISPV